MKPYYEQDGITIYHGDCSEIVPTLDTVDAVISDPPYGVDDTHAGHLSRVTLRDGSPAGQVLGFQGVTQDALVALACDWVTRSRTWGVFTCEWKFMHALDDAGVLVRFGIWRKPDGAPQFTGDRPGTGWEAIAICHRSGLKRWNGGGKHAVWTHAKGENPTTHPTGKPIGLYRDFVSDFTIENDVILDPFMGSGTTLVAAKRLNRRAIGIDIDERYCEMAARRLAQRILPLEA